MTASCCPPRLSRSLPKPKAMAASMISPALSRCTRFRRHWRRCSVLMLRRTGPRRDGHVGRDRGRTLAALSRVRRARQRHAAAREQVAGDRHRKDTSISARRKSAACRRVETNAAAVREAITNARIKDDADVHWVQVKCPLLTSERIAEAAGRGCATATEDSYTSMGCRAAPPRLASPLLWARSSRQRSVIRRSVAISICGRHGPARRPVSN